MGATVIDRKAIQAFPGANGDITTMLQMHPNVQFSTDQKSSNTPARSTPPTSASTAPSSTRTTS